MCSKKELINEIKIVGVAVGIAAIILGGYWLLVS